MEIPTAGSPCAWPGTLFLAFVLALAAPPALAGGGKVPVDVELVLAADVSSSMTVEELALQRGGYAAAFRSPEVISAITHGRYGRVAVTYVEWGASNARRIVVPWTLVADARDAEQVALLLERVKLRNSQQTSISGVIRHGMRAFAGNDYDGLRRIIDISGDGPNNQGGPVTVSRDAAVADGITINGLPLMLKSGPLRGKDLPSLDTYYADCVIGGPLAFSLPVRNWEEFPEAVRRKLALELSGIGATVWKAAAPAPADTGTTNCSIGEELRFGMEWN